VQHYIALCSAKRDTSIDPPWKEEDRKRKSGSPKKEQPISLEQDSGSDSSEYLDAYLEPHNVIPITPVPIERVTPPPFQILSPHLGADRHNQPFLLIAKGVRIVGLDANSLNLIRPHSGQGSGQPKLIPK
jgi:hypothetical protein